MSDLKLINILRNILLEAKADKNKKPDPKKKPSKAAPKKAAQPVAPAEPATPEKKKRVRTKPQGNINSTSRTGIENSLDNRWPMTIFYKGDRESTRGKRIIEPYVLGKNGVGNTVLRAYQVDGMTTSEQPGWKMFRLDRISQTNPQSSKQITKARAGYNASGDLGLSSVEKRIALQQEPEKPKATTKSQVAKPKPGVITPELEKAARDFIQKSGIYVKYTNPNSEEGKKLYNDLLAITDRKGIILQAYNLLKRVFEKK